MTVRSRSSWVPLALAMILAGAAMLAHCASSPPPTPKKRPARPPAQPRRILPGPTLHALPIKWDYYLSTEQPLWLLFDVWSGETLDLDLGAPRDFLGRIAIKSDGREVLYEYLHGEGRRFSQYVPRSARFEVKIENLGIRAQSVHLYVVSRRSLPPPPAPTPYTPAPQPVPRREGTAPSTPTYCRSIPGAADLTMYKTALGFFGTRGAHDERWFSFFVSRREEVRARLTVANRHTTRMAFLDSNGCEKKVSERIIKTGTLRTTLGPGRYYVRVYTTSARKHSVHFQLLVEAGEKPKTPRRPPDRTPVSPPPPVPPPPPPELVCESFDVPSEGEWVVVLDPRSPNDPPTKLRLVVSRAGGSKIVSASTESRQPCLVIQHYHLSAGRYTACAITTETNYRPNVVIKKYPAAKSPPFVE